jgi:hypothetical protein
VWGIRSYDAKQTERKLAQVFSEAVSGKLTKKHRIYI